MGTTESSCVFLGLALRVAWNQRNAKLSPRKNGVKKPNSIGVIKYLQESGYTVSQHYHYRWDHPLVQAILSSVPRAITILFKAAGTSTLTGPQGWDPINLVSEALALRRWTSASVLLDAGAVPEGRGLRYLWEYRKYPSNDKPMVESLIQRMLQLMPKDTTAYGTVLLTEAALRENDFERLEALVKAGFARPSTRMELGERRMEKLMQFLERR